MSCCRSKPDRVSPIKQLVSIENSFVTLTTLKRSGVSLDSKILIIGGGAAGLSAGAKLHKAGFRRFKILEASDRLGGRIHSVPAYSDPDAKGFVELGAQWIHGDERDNIAFKMAHEAGLLDDSSDNCVPCEKFVFRGERGFLSEDIANIYDQLIMGIEEGKKYYSPSRGESFGFYCDTLFHELSKGFDEGQKKYLLPVKDWYHRLVRCYEGADNWYTISYQGTAAMFEECNGNQFVEFQKYHCFSDLISVLSKDIPKKRVLLNSPVTKIDYSDESVIRVTLGDNNEYFEADFVIVTCSLGFLKARGSKLFYPGLPLLKLRAIDLIGFGTVDKIFLEFAQPLKAEDVTGIKFLFDDHGIAYERRDAERDWTRFIIGAYKDIHHSRVLILWLSGEGAKIVQTLSLEKIQADVTGLLRHFLLGMKGFESILEEPISVRKSNWAFTPYVYGSYSYQTVESDLAGVGPETLAMPVGNGRVLFAGEATHEKYFSTVHGAIESGWREADRLIKRL